MHRSSEADPSPDSPDFYGHVKCEHSALALNMTARRRISIEVIYFLLEYWEKFMFFQAYHLLQNLFPSWDTLSTDAEACAICDALVHISKGDKREIRKKAEDEKASKIGLRPCGLLLTRHFD
jgi:hypothetical protein